MTEPTAHQAILFADIVDSTRLYTVEGDARAHRLVAGCMARLSAIAEQEGGRIVKTIGDEIMAQFDTADSAYVAGVAMQSADLGPQIVVRVGFHYGPVIEVSGDVFGDAVNVAARVSSLAHGGEVLLTEDAAAGLTPFLRSRTRLLEEISVKGRAAPVKVFRVVQSTDRLDQDVTAVSLGGTITPHATLSLTLWVGGRENRLDRHTPRLTIGRSDDNDLVIFDSVVSRQHAGIELNRGRFVLQDHSSNGTYVAPAAGEQVFLRRNSVALIGDGVVSFGRAPQDSPDSMLLRFRQQG